MALHRYVLAGIAHDISQGKRVWVLSPMNRQEAIMNEVIPYLPEGYIVKGPHQNKPMHIRYKNGGKLRLVAGTRYLMTGNPNVVVIERTLINPKMVDELVLDELEQNGTDIIYDDTP